MKAGEGGVAFASHKWLWGGGGDKVLASCACKQASYGSSLPFLLSVLFLYAAWNNLTGGGGGGVE